LKTCPPIGCALCAAWGKTTSRRNREPKAGRLLWIKTRNTRARIAVFVNGVPMNGAPCAKGG
jgi:hypothetical protein